MQREEILMIEYAGTDRWAIWQPNTNRHLPRESFSPESGGSMKPSSAIDAIKTHGTMRLKK